MHFQNCSSDTQSAFDQMCTHKKTFPSPSLNAKLPLFFFFSDKSVSINRGYKYQRTNSFRHWMRAPDWRNHWGKEATKRLLCCVDCCICVARLFLKKILNFFFNFLVKRRTPGDFTVGNQRCQPWFIFSSGSPTFMKLSKTQGSACMCLESPLCGGGGGWVSGHR